MTNTNYFSDSEFNGMHLFFIYFHVLEALVHIQNSFRFIDGETAQVLYTCIKIKQLHFINLWLHKTLKIYIHVFRTLINYPVGGNYIQGLLFIYIILHV